jgi:hypothetical protein
MVFWKRSRPAEFDEILAGLDQPQDDCEAGREALSEEMDAEGFFASAAESSSRIRNRWRQALAYFTWHSTWRASGQSFSAADGSAAYAEYAADPVFSGKQPRPKPPPRTEDEAIAEELGLTMTLAKADLVRIRRDFAKKNHPDLCSPAQRPHAARRMSIANMLIDAQLKQLRS